jgi:hypothetical protein
MRIIAPASQTANEALKNGVKRVIVATGHPRVKGKRRQ